MGPEIFSRQIAFWGEEKQALLREAAVFVAGVGGLGCLMSEILVRAGVGTVYLCDKGVIDAPDLNRQLFYRQNDIGKKKLAVAVAWLSQIHPHTRIVPIDEDIMGASFELPADILGVVDCLDNFEARFTLWDKTAPDLFFVHTGVEQFFGQIVSFKKGHGPDFKKIFANYNKEERTIPVSGASASTLAALASNEVINNLFGEPKLLDTLLIVDLSDFTFNKVAL
jgi:molybdopterin/thiamine biosynthesis adenylyltransferase